MRSRTRIASVSAWRMAAFALIAALASAPVALHTEDDEEAAEEHAEDDAAEESSHEEPAADEESAEGGEAATDEDAAEETEETTAREVFAYHGMVIEDGEVVEDPDLAVLEELFGSLDEAGLEVESRAPASLPTTAYAVKCKQAGVPLPPPFTSGDWRKVGRLPANRIFASKLPRADVLVYKPVGTDKKPLGLCVALPRGDESGSVDLLGVICQSKSSGKACFWDNVDRSAVPKLPPTRVKGASLKEVDIDLFQDGALLGENCTNCHRGDNVFVIHEDTFMAQAPMDETTRSPDVSPYAPIGQTAWANPQHANPPSNCTNCHSLPEFSRPYCTTVLLKSLGETMPPAPRPADWKKSYKAELAQICSECGATSGICSP